MAENLVIASNGETKSTCGTHLGHNLPDSSGNRYCIDLVCIAGHGNDVSSGGSGGDDNNTVVSDGSSGPQRSGPSKNVARSSATAPAGVVARGSVAAAVAVAAVGFLLA